ncbi:hypothetical protein ACMAZF_20385 (plasmid) [Psychrobium sp. nBUS_13]|uniref:hypothetical protein n=1 Tax=Psychrobium sp. nBUS_13 TaxID=3395319 RepID=UPI003EB9AE46
MTLDDLKKICESTTRQKENSLVKALRTRYTLENKKGNSMPSIDSVDELKWKKCIELFISIVPDDLKAKFPINFIVVRELLSHDLNLL